MTRSLKPIIDLISSRTGPRRSAKQHETIERFEKKLWERDALFDERIERQVHAHWSVSKALQTAWASHAALRRSRSDNDPRKTANVASRNYLRKAAQSAAGGKNLRVVAQSAAVETNPLMAAKQLL